MHVCVCELLSLNKHIKLIRLLHCPLKVSPIRVLFAVASIDSTYTPTCLRTHAHTRSIVFTLGLQNPWQPIRLKKQRSTQFPSQSSGIVLMPIRISVYIFIVLKY